MPHHRLLSATSGTILTVAIIVFLFGLLTTLFNFRTPHVLPAAQVDVSLTLNYPRTSLIFRIYVNMAGVGVVDGAVGGEGAIGGEGAVGDEGAMAMGDEEIIGDCGAIGDEGAVSGEQG
jgi:hypothetical protein